MRQMHRGQRIASYSALTILLACVAASAHAAGGADCLSEARGRMDGSPAFKVLCAAAADCEFEPSLDRNVSAMAMINAVAQSLQKCWRKAGLATVTHGAAPDRMKLRIRRYTAADSDAASETCKIAELKPFGVTQLTTSFRAQCRGKK